jgi:Kef-type K+ transport system membrane component KefB
LPLVSKLTGCGLSATIFLRNRSKALKVGIGMISRGEVGLIVAGIG